MIQLPHNFRQRLSEERGAVLLTALFFLFCLGSLLSLLLFVEQGDILEMEAQHTADLLSKGARAAGKWEYVDAEGERQSRLFATTEEAEQQDVQIIRGAREEAEILWRLNRATLENGSNKAFVIHQKGEQPHLYRQGIYHVRVTVERRLALLWDEFEAKLDRVSQSGVYE